MRDSTDRFAMPFILPGQAQKEVAHNEALTKIDMMLHPAVEEGPLDTPPPSPEVGQCWIVGSAPTGAWEAQANSIAMWTGGGWRHVAPVPGFGVWDISAGHTLYWNGTTWLAATAVGCVTIGGVQVVGTRQPTIANPSGGMVIDVEARDAIDRIVATLMTHGLIE